MLVDNGGFFPEQDTGLIQGISEWSNPPATELSNLHPTVWWSFVLIILGGIFTVKHFPKKKN